MVEITADIPDPILLKESKNNTSAMKIPKIPLKTRVIYSELDKMGFGIENIIIVQIKPIIPIKFLITLISIARKLFDEISNKITADDQQTAVIIETFGRFGSIRQSGLHFKIPLVQTPLSKIVLASVTICIHKFI